MAYLGGPCRHRLCSTDKCRCRSGCLEYRHYSCSLFCSIHHLSIKYGERKLSTLDVTLLGIALLAIVARLLTGDFVLAIVLTTVAALIGFALTLKKAYRSPNQENAATFFLNSLRNLISLFALTSINFVTLFYPFTMMLANLAVTSTVIAGRRSKR